MINTTTFKLPPATEVKGALIAREALAPLLHNSGLSYTGEGMSIWIIPASVPARLQSRAILIEPGSRAEAGAEREDNAPGNLQQVIVTAEKRKELPQDVPVPVSVVSGETLDEPHVRNEFYATPGMPLPAAALATLKSRADDRRYRQEQT
jgi:hypothetical protein